MEISRTIFEGQISPNNLEVVFCGSTRKTNRTVDELAEKHWKQSVEKSRQEGAKLYDSDVYRFESFLWDGVRGIFKLSTVRYGFNKVAASIPEIYPLGESYYPRGVFTSGIVKTSDGKYVFGVRNKIHQQNAVDLLGGVLSKKEIQLRSGYDVFRALFRELDEEANIKQIDIKYCFLREIIFTNTLRVALVFSVDLAMNAYELCSKFKERSDCEMASLKFLEKREARVFFHALGGYKIEIAKII